MDESPATERAPLALGGEGGGGGESDVPCVVNRETPVELCGLHDLVRCFDSIGLKDDDCETPSSSQLSKEMKIAFLKCVKQDFQNEGFHDIQCSELFYGCEILREDENKEILGHCIWANDKSGRKMIVYYTVPHPRSRVGTLGYQWDVNKFLDRLVVSNTGMRTVIDMLKNEERDFKNMDSDLRDTMKGIKAPAGVIEEGFKIKCAFLDTGHPFSGILNDVSKKIEQIFTALHTKYAPFPKEDKNRAEFIRYAYRVCCYALNRLNDLNGRLTREGGRNLRSLDYFNVKRFSVHGRKTIHSVSKQSSFQLGEDLKKLFDDIDSEVYNIFRLLRDSVLFLTAGKVLEVVETDREIRSRNRKLKRRSSDKELDESEDDDEDELDFWSLDSLKDQSEDDSELLNASLISQLPLFLRAMSSDVMKHIRTKALKDFKQGRCIPETEARIFLVLTKIIKAIHFKALDVDRSIVAYRFIPDFLLSLTPDTSSLKDFRSHLEVLCIRFPHCVWTPPVAAEGSFRTADDNFNDFSDSMSQVVPVQIPPLPELISASLKILSILNVKCESKDTIVTAMQLVNDGALRTKLASKTKAARKRTVGGEGAKICQGTEQSSLWAGNIEAGTDEAVESKKKHRSGSSSGTRDGEDVPGATPGVGFGSRIVAEVNAENVLDPFDGVRNRRGTERLSVTDKGGRRLLKPQSGFEITELLNLREKLAAGNSGKSGSSVSIANTGSIDPCTGDHCTDDPCPVEFLCPDPREYIMRCDGIPKEEKIRAKFSSCTLLEFTTLSAEKHSFGVCPEKCFALVFFEDGDSMATYVDVDLIFRKPSPGLSKKEVGVVMIDGDLYVYNVSRAATRRTKSFSTNTLEHAAGTSGPTGRVEGRKFNYVTNVTDDLASEVRITGKTRAAGSSSEHISEEEHPEWSPSYHTEQCLSRASVDILDGEVKVQNPLNCGAIIFGKLKDGDFVTVNAAALYRSHCTRMVAPTQRRAAMAVESQAGNDVGGDENDGDYAPDGDASVGSSAPQQLCQPMTVTTTETVTHANAPFESFDEMKAVAVKHGWTILNPVRRFCFVFNPKSQTVLMAPTQDLPPSGLKCVRRFLSMMDPEDRTIFGPVYLQFQGVDIEDLMERRISHISKRMFQAQDFKVFQIQARSDGLNYFVQTTEFLDTYLGTMIPGFSAYDSTWVSLFQLCPCDSAVLDPLEHISAQCCFRLADNDPLNDLTTLSQRMQAHQRAPCVITNVNACYIPCPGCRCLFLDLSAKSFNIFLVCKDDPCQKDVSRDGLYVFAATKVKGTEFQWENIESSYGSRRRSRRDKDFSRDSD